ncbi:MAG: hypothetical protein IJ111_02095 [Eggerthellaceae bacterium]|nr:hypothetical protein [Eggerthellaceae bacterium]
MRYGLTFEIEIYDFVAQRGETIYSRPGDYIRMMLWAEKNLDKNLNEDVRSLVTNYATAYIALQREGRVEVLGLPADLSFDNIKAMADRFSVHVELAKKDSLPLAEQPR